MKKNNRWKTEAIASDNETPNKSEISHENPSPV